MGTERGNHINKRYVAGKNHAENHDTSLLFWSSVTNPALVFYLPEIYPILINCPDWSLFTLKIDGVERRAIHIWGDISSGWMLGPRAHTTFLLHWKYEHNFSVTRIPVSLWQKTWRVPSIGMKKSPLVGLFTQTDFTRGKWGITCCQAICSFPEKMEVGTCFPVSQCLPWHDNNVASHLCSAFGS